MKLKEEFITHNTEEESLLVPTGEADFSGLVRGNRTMGVILDLLKTETTEEEIISAMYQRFDASKEVIASDVRRILDELGRIGAIDA